MSVLSDVHIIVVTCNEQRKQIIAREISDLQISISYTFFQGFTPEMSQSYMIDRDTRSAEEDTTLCCMRSHAAAIDHFVKHYPDAKYLLILEDDVALLRNFESELVRVLQRWSLHEDEIDFVSLGYFPKKPEPLAASKANRPLRWNLTETAWGAQAYIVKRSVAEKMAHVLHHPTSKDVRNAVQTYVQNELKGQSYSNKHPCVQADALLSIGWRQAIVFPIMVIELPVTSVITPGFNRVSTGMWDHVFTTGDRKKDDFYTLPSTPNYNKNKSVSTKPSAISLLKALTAPKKRLILSADHHSPYEGTDEHWSYCIPMTEAYAKIIGVDFKFELIKDSIRGRHFAWSKIAVLSKYVKLYDEIVWVGSDTTVVNHKVNVFDYIKTAPLLKGDSPSQPIIYTLSDQARDPCTSIFLLDCGNKQKAMDVLEQWWNDIPDKSYEITYPWDQSVWKSWTFNDRTSCLRVGIGTSKIDGHKHQLFAHVGRDYGIVRTSVAKKYFNRLLQPKQKRIGILVRQQNYYTNGCGQNCIFMKHSLESLGYWVDLLVDYESDKPDKVSDAIPYSYTKISYVNFADYNIVIFGSKLPSASENDRMKKAGVRRIVFNPTNVMDALHNEHFLYKCRESTLPVQEMTYKDIADEVWIIDSHKDTTLTYIEVINKNKIPVHAVPHIWSPLFLNDKDGTMSTNKPSSRKQLDIVIMEPNLGYCKSGWLPLVICEKLCLEQPELIHQVFLFGAPSHPTAVGMMESLDLWKLKKLRIMGRIPITNILSFFSNADQHGDYMTVFLSHQINIPLNYAYFDALYTGFPLIHNSKSLKEEGLGYYYDGIDEGANTIIKASDTFEIEESMQRSRKILEERNPYNETCVSEFRKILTTTDARSSVSKNPEMLEDEPTLVITNIVNTKLSKIPKVIYMCYKTLDKLQIYAQNWKKLNPEYEIKLYDDELCKKFLLDEYSQLHLDIFNYIPDGPIKADFWRVCVLYKYGGLYVDADINPLVPLREYLEDDDNFATCISCNFDTKLTSGHFNPHFILAKAHDPILKACVDEYLHKYTNKLPYSYWSWSIIHVMKIPGVTERKSQTLIMNNKKFKFLYERNYDECEYNGVLVLKNRYDNYVDHKFVDETGDKIPS